MIQIIAGGEAEARGIENGDAESRNWSWLDESRRIAAGIRRRVLSHTVNHGGYLSQACSSAEIFGLLYGDTMQLGPSEGPAIPPPFAGSPSASNPTQTSGMPYNGRRALHLDRFVLSPTHYAMTLYATLIETGRRGEDGLEQFNVGGSSVEMIGGEHSTGHEVNGGSFGQAISQCRRTISPKPSPLPTLAARLSRPNWGPWTRR